MQKRWALVVLALANWGARAGSFSGVPDALVDAGLAVGLVGAGVFAVELGRKLYRWLQDALDSDDGLTAEQKRRWGVGDD